MRMVVIGEIAVAVALAIGAGLAVSSLRALNDLELGFERESRYFVRAALPPSEYGTHEARRAFAEELVDRLRARGDIVQVGMTTNVPLDDLSWDAVYTARGGAPMDPRQPRFIADRMVTPGYLEALGVELVSGRLIDRADGVDGRAVVVVTSDLATEAWPGLDPLGQQIKRGRPDGDAPWMTVIGVVEPVKEDRAAFRRDRPAWYVPYAQYETTRRLALLIEGDASTAAAVRRTARAVDSRVTLYGFSSLNGHTAGMVASDRFAAFLVGAFATLGLTLAALGVYGVSSYAVASRRRDFGILMALGARPSRVLRGVLLDGFRVALWGTSLGACLALLLRPLLASVLFRVHSEDTVVFSVAIALGLVTTLVACYAPARRAMSVDAAVVLRGE